MDMMSLAQLKRNQKIQLRNYEQNWLMRDYLISTAKSQNGYTDNPVVTESWNDLSAWTTAATPGVQVSGNKLFSTGSGGANSGANYSYAMGADDQVRAVFRLTVPSIGTSGGIMIGVSKDASGAVPTSSGGAAFGLYFSSNGFLFIMDNGTTTAPAETTTYTAGDYIITLTIDKTYISVSSVKTDGTQEACARKLRSAFAVNNLFVFNSDSRGLSGMYIQKFSFRKGLQTVAPRLNLEGVTKTIQWTGDGTQSFRIYLPKTYDSRVPNPAVICFHGNGSSEADWSINANMKTMQKALVNAGFVVLTCAVDANKMTWGNTTATAAYYEAYKYLRSNYAISSIAFYANSMGGIESLNTLMENKIPCCSWVATVPTFSLKNNYDNSMFTSIITNSYAIYNGATYDGKTSGRDPAINVKNNPFVFRSVPMMILAPPDDTSVSKTENADKLAAAVKSTSTELIAIDVPSGGHSFDITPYTDTMIAFFVKYSAF